MRSAAKIPDHHAETMIERYGDAYFFFFGILKSLADKISVVQNIVMRKCNALGKTGSAGSVLYIDGIIELQRGFYLVELRIGYFFSAGYKLLPVFIEIYCLPQIRTAFSRFIDHGLVVGSFEMERGDYYAAS